MDSNPIRVHVRISGRVQGVFYRASARDAAHGLGLTGWVQNRPDGSVELVAEGSRERVEQLLDWCRRGPDLARVDNLEVTREDATGEFSGFRIRH